MPTTTTTTESAAIELSENLVRRATRRNSSKGIGLDEPNSPRTVATFKDQQSNVLPHKKLMIVFPSIALAQMISYLDQTSVSTALPAIEADLNIGPSISWVATSFLLASTSVQLINGRLSDIFGRKPLLLTCMGLLAIGNLGAGFSTSAAMLFAFRALSGLGGGAITALVMIVSSDITTLEQRGKYNGFIGAMVAIGNGIGPLIGGAVTQQASWRWCFWFIVPVIIAVMILIAIVIPSSNAHGKAWTKLNMIDCLGLFINVAAVILILIPVSVGGSIYAWNIGLSSQQGSIVGALLNLGLGVGRPIVGHFSDSIGRLNMASIATASFLVGMVCGTFWSTIAPVGAEVVGLKNSPSARSLTFLVITIPTTCTFLAATIMLTAAFCSWIVRACKITDMDREALQKRLREHVTLSTQVLATNKGEKSLPLGLDKAGCLYE